MEIEIPHTFTLSKPLKWGESEIITEVIFEREPTGGDMVYAQNAGDKVGEFTLRLLERTTNLQAPQLKALRLRDFVALAQVVQSFLPDGPAIG